MHAIWNLIFFVDYIMNVNDIQCFSVVTFWGMHSPIWMYRSSYSELSVSDTNSSHSYILGG